MHQLVVASAHPFAWSRLGAPVMSDQVGRTAPTVAAALAAAGIAGVGAVNGVFGVLDNTADELADILGVDDVPPAVAAVVRELKPLYAPIKSVTPSCTSALFPEFNEMLDMNDCLLLPSRVFPTKSGLLPISIRQTMTTGSMWQVSTGSTVWGGGVVLQRFMETLGNEYWQGKRVIELGTGTGLGSVAAAKLGASYVLATDRDADVLALAEANARSNGAASVFHTSSLEWGPAPADGAAAAEPAYSQDWDVVIGADLTYNKDGWVPLVQTIKRLRAPVILSASERRPDELRSLSQFFTEAGLEFEVLPSPMSEGYAASNIKVFRIARPTAAAAQERPQQPPQQPPPPLQASAAARGRPSAVDALKAAEAPAPGAPSVKERTGALLRAAFNGDAPGASKWFEVDPPLKQARLDWARQQVASRDYDPSRPPTPPAALLRP